MSNASEVMAAGTSGLESAKTPMLGRVDSHRELYDSDRESARKHPDFFREWVEGRNASVPSGVFNLVSTIIGGGVLSLPFAMKQCGFVLFVVLLGVAALTTDWSVYLLISCGRRTGARTYKEVAEMAFGRGAGLFINLCICGVTLLLLVAYGVIIRDIVPPVLVQVHILSSPTHATKTIVMVVCVALITPLCLFKDLNALRFTSALAIFTVTVLLSCLVYHVGAMDRFGHSVNSMQMWPKDIGGCLSTFSILAVAFVCHFNVLSVHKDLVIPSRDRIKRVTHTTVATCTVLYLLCACTGYVLFLDDTEDNIFNNFSDKDVAMTVGRLGLVITIMFSFPLICLPCRTNLLEFADAVLLWRSDSAMQRSLVQQQPEEEAQEGRLGSSPVWRSGVALTIMAVAVSLSSVVKTVATVWNLLGSTLAILVAFVLPALFYLKIRKPGQDSSMNRPTWALLAFGAVAFVMCTYQAISTL